MRACAHTHMHARATGLLGRSPHSVWPWGLRTCAGLGSHPPPATSSWAPREQRRARRPRLKDLRAAPLGVSPPSCRWLPRARAWRAPSGEGPGGCSILRPWSPESPARGRVWGLRPLDAKAGAGLSRHQLAGPPWSGGGGLGLGEEGGCLSRRAVRERPVCPDGQPGCPQQRRLRQPRDSLLPDRDPPRPASHGPQLCSRGQGVAPRTQPRPARALPDPSAPPLTSATL